jgi:hypothetical protein
MSCMQIGLPVVVLNSRKAGRPAKARREGARFYTFRATLFGEADSP